MSLSNTLHSVQTRNGGERRIHVDRRKEKRVNAVSDRRLINERRN